MLDSTTRDFQTKKKMLKCEVCDNLVTIGRLRCGQGSAAVSCDACGRGL